LIVLSLAAIPLGAVVGALRDPTLHRRSRFWLRFAGFLICMVLPWTVGLVEAAGEQVGIPLLDAEPSSSRVRGPHTPRRLGRPRRAARERERRPSRLWALRPWTRGGTMPEKRNHEVAW
jgi:hypothetical protein